MVRDIIIALIITVIGVVLGIAVHPVLFFIVVLAVVYLLARVRSRREPSCHRTRRDAESGRHEINELRRCVRPAQ
jgi:membrane protein implicated in regulation of membrane protease activity